MIALHFRDNPADLLRRTSIPSPGSFRHFGDRPFPLAENPFPCGQGTHVHRTSIDSQFSIDIGSISLSWTNVNIYLTFVRDLDTFSGKIKTDQQKLICFMAPPVGLEPTTCGLTVRRSTD